MTDQVIITFGRECGSGGHIIAEQIASRLGIPVYNRNLLDEVAKEHNIENSELHNFDEVPRNLFLSRSVGGYSNSPEELVAKMQFDYLREQAALGKSFVVVGRCAEDVLKDYDCLISIFVTGNKEDKIKQIVKEDGLSPKEAEEFIHKKDKQRKSYHNFFSKTKWGDSRYYDLVFNASYFNIEQATDIIADYIEARRNAFKNK